MQRTLTTARTRTREENKIRDQIEEARSELSYLQKELVALEKRLEDITGGGAEKYSLPIDTPNDKAKRTKELIIQKVDEIKAQKYQILELREKAQKIQREKAKEYRRQKNLF